MFAWVASNGTHATAEVLYMGSVATLWMLSGYTLRYVSVYLCVFFWGICRLCRILDESLASSILWAYERDTSWDVDTVTSHSMVLRTWHNHQS